MEKKKEFILNVTYYAIWFGFGFLVYKYLLPVLTPFLFAFLFAYLSIKICRNIFKQDNNLYRSLGLLAIYVVIILISTLLIVLGINKIGEFFATLPDLYKKVIEPALTQIEKAFNIKNTTLPNNITGEVNETVVNVFDSLRTVLSSLATLLVSGTTNVIAGTPEFVVSVLVTVISSFYIVFDFENITTWFTTKVFSKKTLKLFNEIKDFCEGTLTKVILSYIKIMGITFVELLIGFLIIGIKNSTVIALVVCVLDILPILGVGTVLIPWAIIALISKDVFVGVGLLILYVVITIIRNIIEPKIVGGDLHLDAFVTLVSMIVGLRLFGAIGMIGCPLLISFLEIKKKKKATTN